MRVTKEQAAINRRRIIESAIRLFGQRGVDGVGVAEVMADAGFTHGGFYNHFSSKDDLVLEACSTSLRRSVARLRQDPSVIEATEDGLDECLSAALLSESAKSGGRLGSVYADGVRSFLDVLSRRHGDRAAATSELACLVGARVLSSAVASADADLAREFTDAAPKTQERARLQASS